MATNGWVQMDRLEQPKYLDVRNKHSDLEVPRPHQPDLEVGDDPYRSPHTGWPEPAHAVWGDASNKKKSENDSAEKIFVAPTGLGEGKPAARTILGLSVRMFWSMMVLLF